MLHVYATGMEKYCSNLSHSNDLRETRNGDVNAWWHGLFQLADRDFPKSVLIGSIALFLILSQHEAWKKKTKKKQNKKKQEVQRLLQSW